MIASHKKGGPLSPGETDKENDDTTTSTVDATRLGTTCGTQNSHTQAIVQSLQKVSLPYLD